MAKGSTPICSSKNRARLDYFNPCWDFYSCFMYGRRTVTKAWLGEHLHVQPYAWRIPSQRQALPHAGLSAGRNEHHSLLSKFIPALCEQGGLQSRSVSWTACCTASKCYLIPSLSLFASASSHGTAFCCANRAEKCPEWSVFTKLLKGEFSQFLPAKNRLFFLFPPSHPWLSE